MNIQQIYGNQLIAGSPNTTFNLDLGAGGVNIIQSIYISFDSIGGAAVNSCTMGSWDGTNFNIFLANPGPFISSQNILIDRTTPIVVPTQFIQFNYASNVPGDTISVVVSYFQIPNTNTISNDFYVATGSVTESPLTLLDGPASGAYRIKSVVISEVGINTPSVNLTLTTPLATATLTSSQVINNSSTTFLSNKDYNIFLTNDNYISLVSGSIAGDVSYYVSYTYDLLDV